MRCMLLAVLTFSVGVWSGEAPPLTIEARGLSVAGDGYGEFMNGVQPFNNNLGTRVALLVQAPAGGLLKFDSDKSKVAVFQDDKGKDLLKAKKNSFRGPGFGAFANISKDTKACIVEVESSELPTKGSAGVTISGEAVFTFATQKKDFEAPNVNMKSGTMFKASDLNFEIKKVGKADFDAENWPVEVEFAFKQNTSKLAGLKFVDASGAEIQSERAGSSSMHFGNSVSESISFKLKKPAETVKVIATFWMDMKDISVPFNLKVGPGL